MINNQKNRGKFINNISSNEPTKIEVIKEVFDINFDTNTTDIAIHPQIIFRRKKDVVATNINLFITILSVLSAIANKVNISLEALLNNVNTGLH